MLMESNPDTSSYLAVQKGEESTGVGVCVCAPLPVSACEEGTGMKQGQACRDPRTVRDRFQFRAWLYLGSRH